jgi:hypothetical protein
MRTESNATQNSSFGLTPPWKVLSVIPLPNFQLSVTFNNGLSGIVDLNTLVHSSTAGVFSSLSQPELFEQVFVEYGVVTWPGELDLAPDAMYNAISKLGSWVL